MIDVGLNKEAIKEARDTIMDILRSSVGDTVKQSALQTLSTLCAPSLTMTGCTLTPKE